MTLGRNFEFLCTSEFKLMHILWLSHLSSAYYGCFSGKYGYHVSLNRKWLHDTYKKKYLLVNECLAG